MQKGVTLGRCSQVERKFEGKIGLRNEAEAGDLGSPAEGLNTKLWTRESTTNST